MRSKRLIASWAEAGVEPDFREVAVLTRRGYIRMRHAWPDSSDARAYDTVMRVVRRRANELANERGRPIEVYDRADYILLTVEYPDEPELVE